MARYSTLIFDLFDTLVLFNRERLPMAQIGGRQVRSTVGYLYPILREVSDRISIEEFYQALRWSYEEAERLRGIDYREVPARERFGLLMRTFGLEGKGCEETAARLMATHMEQLSRVVEFPESHRGVLEWARGRFRLGIITNFDYSPTVRLILDRHQIGDCFGAVVVSADVGWRKPKSIIFEKAFGALGIAPREALFVGDTPSIDIVGARGVGMDVVWVNREGAELGSGLPLPDFTVRELPEIRALLDSV